MTSPLMSLIGMHRSDRVLYPVCWSMSWLNRSSWNKRKLSRLERKQFEFDSNCAIHWRGLLQMKSHNRGRVIRGGVVTANRCPPHPEPLPCYCYFKILPHQNKIASFRDFISTFMLPTEIWSKCNKTLFPCNCRVYLEKLYCTHKLLQQTPQISCAGDCNFRNTALWIYDSIKSTCS